MQAYDQAMEHMGLSAWVHFQDTYLNGNHRESLTGDWVGDSGHATLYKRTYHSN